MQRTEIIIQRGLLKAGNIGHKIATRLAIITDDYVKKLYGSSLEACLQQQEYETFLFSIPTGEKSKSRECKEELEDRMLAAGLGRDSGIIALGGGVVTDLAGFVAATYCRGIPFISIPTTLMAQVDASMGGKVGVNTPYGKNLIGAYYPPIRLLIDPDTLTTLPKEEIRNGMAEVIKYACIASPTLFQELQENNISLDRIIETSCAIKREIVEKDPYETGLRRVVNFGHTIGHAIEAAASYQIAHGEAVALGICAEAALSMRLGYLKEEEWRQIDHLLKHYGFSLQLPEGIEIRDLIHRMKWDKKAVSQQIRCVLLSGIGTVVSFEGHYCTPIDPQQLQEVLEWLF